MLGMDLLQDGPGSVAPGLTGLIVGHLWWWTVWGGMTASAGNAATYRGMLGALGTAPRWVRNLFGEGAGPGPGLGATAPVEGVHVIRPRTSRLGSDTATAATSGYQWGSGRRLGDR
jgi:Derlin-2/3